MGIQWFKSKKADETIGAEETPSYFNDDISTTITTATTNNNIDSTTEGKPLEINEEQRKPADPVQEFRNLLRQTNFSRKALAYILGLNSESTVSNFLGNDVSRWPRRERATELLNILQDFLTDPANEEKIKALQIGRNCVDVFGATFNNSPLSSPWSQRKWDKHKNRKSSPVKHYNLNDPNLATLQKEFRNLLLTCGLTLKEEAKALNVSNSLIGNWRGNNPSVWVPVSKVESYLDTLKAYLKANTKSVDVPVTNHEKTKFEIDPESGIIVGSKPSPMAKVIAQITDQLNVIATKEERLQMVLEETHKELQQLESEKAELMTTVQTLRKLNN